MIAQKKLYVLAFGGPRVRAKLFLQILQVIFLFSLCCGKSVFCFAWECSSNIKIKDEDEFQAKKEMRRASEKARVKDQNHPSSCARFVVGLAARIDRSTDDTKPEKSQWLLRPTNQPTNQETEQADLRTFTFREIVSPDKRLLTLCGAST